MHFSEIIGQADLINKLTLSTRQGLIPHAQLIIGTEGSQALAFALAYAQYLQCESPETIDSCGQCRACKKAEKYIHPDIHFSYPTIGTGKISTDFIQEWRKLLVESEACFNLFFWLSRMGAENQQGNINKNECHDIIRKFYLTKVEGKRKILIMWLPEFLEKEGNRLLKLIEEPEPDTVFLLVTERPEKVLNTILSRCQQVKLKTTDDQTIADFLQNKFQLSREKALPVAYLAQNNLLKAIQLLDMNQNNDANVQIFGDWMRAVYVAKDTIFQYVEFLSSGKNLTDDKKSISPFGRKEQISLLQYALFFFSEMHRLNYLGIDNSKLNAVELKTAQGLNKIIQAEDFVQITQWVNEAIYKIERNANPKPMWMSLSLKINKILKKV